MAYWLFKTEPSTFSWNDLVAAPDQSTQWEGVRNYQARNMLRDEVAVGDEVLIYHSVVQPQVVAGIATVVRAAYPDHHSWDPDSRYFDPKSSPESPRWMMVDVRAARPFSPPITRDEIKACPELAGMDLLRKGNRLSIQRVTPEEWQALLALR